MLDRAALFNAIPKLTTGIEALDLNTGGGIPVGRTPLVSGTADSAKTVMAVQFLAAGILNYNEGGVFVYSHHIGE